MAEKKVFFCDEKNIYEEKLITYTYYPGFAVSQKQKSIASLHEAIHAQHPDAKVLEISTKSPAALGVELSAFNLKFFHEGLAQVRNLENIFQSSKVFESGGPYRELLNVLPKDAKRDNRLHESGKLIGFNLYGENWPLEPKTMFYDWIYISALKHNIHTAEKLLDYDVFTDIEFNHKKSVNCQSRAAAIFVSLCRLGKLEDMTKDKESFSLIYSYSGNGEQLSLL